MNNYTTVFRQMLSMIPQSQIEKEAEEHGYNRYTKHFTVWNQFKVNLYSQISGKKSLRDIETGLKVQQNDWYHLGLKNVSRSQLANVNKRRSYEIFQHLYYELYARCSDITPQHKFRFKNPLHIMDSSVITLCSSLFPWAEYTQQKGALKLHTLLDYKGTIPSFVAIETGKSSDITVAKESDLPLSKDSIIVGDRAYIDFEWLTKLNSEGIFFVVRVKGNLKYKVIRQQIRIQKEKTLSDEEILLTGVETSKSYSNPLRLIKLRIEKRNLTLLLITNHFKFAASTIAQIYKARWEIEKFFRWIKQNLKIKTFLGTSQNAVLIQIWTALTYYLLLAYIKFQTKYQFSLLHFARVLGDALFKKVDIIDTLNINPIKFKKDRDPCVQKKLFDLQKFS